MCVRFEDEESELLINPSWGHIQDHHYVLAQSPSQLRWMKKCTRISIDNIQSVPIWASRGLVIRGLYKGTLLLFIATEEKLYFKCVMF